MKSMKRKRNRLRAEMSDNEWIRLNFGRLIKKHGGKYAVVAEGELFIGTDAAALEKEARRKHPHIVPSGFPVPRTADLTCVL